MNKKGFCSSLLWNEQLQHFNEIMKILIISLMTLVNLLPTRNCCVTMVQIPTTVNAFKIYQFISTIKNVNSDQDCGQLCLRETSLCVAFLIDSSTKMCYLINRRWQFEANNVELGFQSPTLHLWHRADFSYLNTCSDKFQSIRWNNSRYRVIDAPKIGVSDTNNHLLQTAIDKCGKAAKVAELTTSSEKNSVIKQVKKIYPHEFILVGGIVEKTDSQKYRATWYQSKTSIKSIKMQKPLHGFNKRSPIIIIMPSNEYGKEPHFSLSLVASKILCECSEL